jgi:hypothetical protein
MKLMKDRENINQGGDEDDENHEGSRTRPPHLKVHQIVQKYHLVDNILGDTKKGETNRSHVANFCKH